MVAVNTHAELKHAADQSSIGLVIAFPLTDELCRMLEDVSERTELEGAELLGYLLRLERATR
jgi:hypothetical protein